MNSQCLKTKYSWNGGTNQTFEEKNIVKIDGSPKRWWIVGMFFCVYGSKSEAHKIEPAWPFFQDNIGRVTTYIEYRYYIDLKEYIP